MLKVKPLAETVKPLPKVEDVVLKKEEPADDAME